jgi:hypothetical protein
MAISERGREPEDPTGYRKQAVRLANERDYWKALAKSWGDEKDRLTAEHRGAVEALRLIADPPMGDDYTAPREYAEWLRDQARRALERCHAGHL